jgi:predicted O-methyltransferase YrrM
LNFFQKIGTLPLFIHYFFKVVDRHSIQAPFAFQFIDSLQKAIVSSRPIPDIEHERTSFAKDRSPVNGTDFGAGTSLGKSTIAKIARFGISSKYSCVFLHELANMAKAATCVELGTSLGIASAYIGRSRSLEKLYSFEGNGELAARAEALHKRLMIDKVQVIKGNIDDKLPTFLDGVGTIDLAIIDANHTSEALAHYFQLLKSKMEAHSIIFIDDIRWSRDMYSGWQELSQRSEVTVSMEFLNFGLLFFEKGLQKQHYILTI